MPLYYEGGDGYLDVAPQATDCNNGLDHLEETEGPVGTQKPSQFFCFAE